MQTLQLRYLNHNGEQEAEQAITAREGRLTGRSDSVYPLTNRNLEAPAAKLFSEPLCTPDAGKSACEGPTGPARIMIVHPNYVPVMKLMMEIMSAGISGKCKWHERSKRCGRGQEEFTKHGNLHCLSAFFSAPHVRGAPLS